MSFAPQTVVEWLGVGASGVLSLSIDSRAQLGYLWRRTLSFKVPGAFCEIPEKRWQSEISMGGQKPRFRIGVGVECKTSNWGLDPARSKLDDGPRATNGAVPCSKLRQSFRGMRMTGGDRELMGFHGVITKNNHKY